MKDEHLYNLAHAEAMTWNVNRIPFTVAESDGPLVVKLRGDVVRMFRWFHHPRMVDGVLQILDASGRSGLRLVQEYRKGEWDECLHDVRYAGLY